jgi:hypothetical protein
MTKYDEVAGWGEMIAEIVREEAHAAATCTK